MQKLLHLAFWKSKPLIEWIDKTFTWPYTIKKLTGKEYYENRDQIIAGHVFLTNVQGHGSNYINPAKVNHGSIYFGRGLRSYLDDLIDRMNIKWEQTQDPYYSRTIDRLFEFRLNNNLRDDICYVIEALGAGVQATDLVTFITTKDELYMYKPKFTGVDGMRHASRQAVEFLGQKYDYGFEAKNEYKYCFEVPAVAYEKTALVKLKRKEFNIFGRKLFESFMAETFFDETMWEEVIKL